MFFSDKYAAVAAKLLHAISLIVSGESVLFITSSTSGSPARAIFIVSSRNALCARAIPFSFNGTLYVYVSKELAYTKDRHEGEFVI